MNKHLLPYSVFLLFVCFASCKGQNQTDPSKGNRNPLESDLPRSIPTVTELDTLLAPNAPHRITRKIKKDKEGNLVIAAFEDIIRYDGKSFTNLPKQIGLDSYDVFDVLEDKKGNIWIASTRFGVFRHDRKSLTLFNTDDGLAHNRSMCIYEDRAGNIWIGGQGGASCYDGKTFQNFTTNEGMAHNDVSCIMEDKTGKIWFGTRGNACVYTPSSLPGPGENTFTEITDDQGVPFTNIWSIIEDKKGNIWIGGGGGLWRYDGLSFTNVTTEFVVCVYEDQKGNIWITTTQGRLARYDSTSLLTEQATAIQVFKGTGMLFGMTEDKKGDIWVGALNGVYRYDGNTVTYFKDNKARD